MELCRIKGRNYSIVLNDLFAAIIPEESSVKVRTCTLACNYLLPAHNVESNPPKNNLGY